MNSAKSKLRRGVGLLIITKVPNVGLVAILQARGYFNTEEMRPQYYAGGCQVTVYGGIHKGESQRHALFRETKEELGKEVYALAQKVKIFKVADFSRDNERGTIYCTFLDFNFLPKIRLGPDSGGIRLVKLKELQKARDLNKLKAGVAQTSIIAVFPDTKRAVKKAFAIIRKNS